MLRKRYACLVLALAVMMPLEQAMAQEIIASQPVGATQADQSAAVMHAVDLLNYKLTVQWDQKDPAFYSAAATEFTTALARLKASGVTDEIVLNTIKTRVLNAQGAADVDRILSIMSQQRLPESETAQVVAQLAAQAQHDGAHWAGDVIVISVVVLLLLGFSITAVVVVTPHHNN